MTPADRVKYNLLQEQAQETTRLLRKLTNRLIDPSKPVNRKRLADEISQITANLEGMVYPSVRGADGARLALSNAPGAAAEPLPSDLVKFASIQPAAKRKSVESGRKDRRWTKAQKHAISMTLGEDARVKIAAGAGTGKTTTLEGVAQQHAGNGLYVAYNKDVQRDAAPRFGRNVTALTIHSIAHAHLGRQWADAGKHIRNIRSRDVQALLDLGENRDRPSVLQAIRETHAAFLSTTDREVSEIHVPRNFRARVERELRAAGCSPTEAVEATRSLSAEVARHAQSLWGLVSDISSPAPLPHDAYLKLWAMSEPTVDADYILLDEAQDTTPIVQQVFARQNAKLIMVGDQYQAIYQFRGAVNAMALLPGNVAHLLESFRFGPAIADCANNILRLRGEDNLLVGAGDPRGRVGPVDKSKPYTVIARTNATLCKYAADLCLEHPTAVVGGAAEMLALLQSAFALFTGDMSQVKHPSLSFFKSYKQLQDAAAHGRDPEIGPVVSIIEANGAGTRRIIGSLSTGLVDEGQAHVVLTTAHKSKGREWNQVLLADDFPNIRDVRGEINEEEANLLYVAATRARHVLEPNRPLAALDGEIKGGPHLLLGRPGAALTRSPADQEAEPPDIDWAQ